MTKKHRHDLNLKLCHCLATACQTTPNGSLKGAFEDEVKRQNIDVE